MEVYQFIFHFYKVLSFRSFVLKYDISEKVANELKGKVTNHKCLFLFQVFFCLKLSCREDLGGKKTPTISSKRIFMILAENDIFMRAQRCNFHFNRLAGKMESLRLLLFPCLFYAAGGVRRGCFFLETFLTNGFSPVLFLSTHQSCKAPLQTSMDRLQKIHMILVAIVNFFTQETLKSRKRKYPRILFYFFSSTWQWNGWRVDH